MKEIVKKLDHYLSIEKLKQELSDLEKRTNEIDFWEKEENQIVIERIAYLKKLISDWQEIESYADKDHSNSKKLIIKFFLNYILNDKYDKKSSFLNIYAGAGGKDAEDWVGMLRRMYEKFFQRISWEYFLIDEQANDTGGYKFISFEVKKEFSYGILKSEKGVHRLVRISPFSAQRLRHTSFAYVEVLPLIEKPDFKIKEEDIEFQAFRAGGPGGQNVNKLETAVRIIYKPLNLVVTCQSERYQHRNREIALQILYSKIQNILDEQQKKEIEELKGQKIEIGWGFQTRNYILDPYKLIKDLKSKKETNQVEAVLNGGIELIHPFGEILEIMIK